MSISVKICGVKTEEAVNAAVKSGVGFLGFNFCAASPRFVTPEQAAQLAPLVPPSIQKVALFVDPKDGELEDTLNVFNADMIQLHGMESPSRVAEIKRLYGKPIMKAIALSQAEDLEETVAYENIVNWFLFDALAPKGSKLPGGNAVSFNWNIMKDYASPLPWMLAGGINASNIKQAVEQSGAKVIDVSSGVEITRGQKDPALITQLLELAKKI
ncbi:MAG: phosphoribosylanthranilate isomerase [Alphaproteobacteria bacterium]|nr:phosphoribosylanthranilate isomerase [Alphaproteobacteria bacterium]